MPNFGKCSRNDFSLHEFEVKLYMRTLIKKIWPIIIIIALWVAVGAPYFFKGKIPFPSTYLVSFFAPWNASYGMPVKNNAMPDVISQIVPWKKLTIETWKQGMVPLWNPYSFSGTPQAANYQSAVFSPMNILFFLFPFVDAWSLLVLLQPLFGAIGMFLFLRSVDRSRLASLLGAIGFMYCGFMTTWAAYATLGYAALMLPWIFWAITRGFVHRQTIFGIVASVFLMCSFFSGHFQISLYVFAASCLYVLFLSYVKKDWRKGGLFLLFLGFGILLSMPQILLTLNTYAGSTRSSSFIKGEVIPWRYLVTIFSPDFFGNPVTRNDWFGHYAEWAGYVGVVPLLLSFFAIMKKKQNYILFFVVLSVIAILFAFPTPLNDLLFRLHLPVVSTSAASRIIILFSFSFASLAAFGLDELYICWIRKEKRPIIVFSAAILVSLAVLWGLLLCTHILPADAIRIARRNTILPTGLSLGIVCFMLVGIIDLQITRFAAVFFFMVLLCFDSYRYVSKWMPFDDRQYLYPQEKSLTFLEQNAGNFRVFGNIGNEVGGPFHLQLIEGYDAMYSSRYGEFINAMSKGIIVPGERSVVQFDKYGVYKTQALELLGVRYIYQRISDGRNVWAFPYWEYLEDGSMKSVYRDGQYEIFEFAKAFPRAFLASAYVRQTDDQKIIDTVTGPDFPLRDTLVLEKDPDLLPQKGDGTASIVSYQATKVTIQTSSPVAKLLFLSDTYDAGWHASIDGKETTIYRADYDFRAVSVPPGSHMVQFTYAPDGMRLGIICVSIAFIGLVIVFVTTKRYEHRYI